MLIEIFNQAAQECEENCQFSDLEIKVKEIAASKKYKGKDIQWLLLGYVLDHPEKFKIIDSAKLQMRIIK